MLTVHRASTGADWREATALLYDYVEWVRGWTGVDPVAEQPQLRTELVRPADHFATDDAVLYLAAWEASAVGAVADSRPARRKRRAEADVRTADCTWPRRRWIG